MKPITYYSALRTGWEYTPATPDADQLLRNVIDWARDGIGHSNAGTIIHWREKARSALAIGERNENDTD